MQNKTFDLIIWGATGFTGQLVVEYIWKEYGTSSFKWAIAGRNEGKLEQVRTKFGLQNVPYLLADSKDLASLKNLARQSKVICSTVGPYSLYGDALVQACVEESCNYCDLTGEIPWMRKTIDQFFQKASDKKIKIVHCCGFDSIPSDFGTLKVQQAFFKKYGYYAHQVSARIGEFKGWLSGGTYYSMSNLISEAGKNTSIQKLLKNLYSLNPDPKYSGADDADLRTVKKDSVTGEWICPFIMSGINTRVVRRTHALMGFPYGHQFKYNEAQLCGKGLKGRLKANAILIFLGLFMSAKPGTFVKKIFDWFMPEQGEGPDEKSRNEGYYNFLFSARGKDNDVCVLKLHGERDPGYGSTSRMLAESAICLIFSEKLPEVYGVLTPSYAMGEELFKRLEAKAGLAFSVQNYITKEK